MKAHMKKRAYRLQCKRLAQAGSINNAAGQWVSKSQVPSNAMVRDFHTGGRK